MLLVLGLPLMLCCAALCGVVFCWRFASGVDGRRLKLFQAGVILGTIGLLATALCFIDPFPLYRHHDGSLSILWLEGAWLFAFCSEITSFLLGLFGKGTARVVLSLISAFALLLTFAAVLQNGV